MAFIDCVFPSGEMRLYCDLKCYELPDGRSGVGQQCQLTGCATKKKELRVRVHAGASGDEDG